MKNDRFISRVATIILPTLFLCGCQGGNLSSEVMPVQNRDIGMVFKYNSLDFQDNGTLDVLDEPLALIDRSKLAQISVSRYQSVFSDNNSQEAIPLSVNIKQRSENLGNLAWAVVPQAIWFFGTLGILPIYYPTMDFIYDVEVNFSSKWGKQIFTAQTEMILHENYWFGSLPFFYAFYSHGKISIADQQRILEFTGNPITYKQLKSDFIGTVISDTVTRLILAQRKELMKKILFAEVENRWGIFVGYETENALYASDDAKIMYRNMIKKSWNRSRIKTFSGKKVIKNELEGALENYLGNAKNRDIIFLFMSGEIYRDETRPDDVYFVCADSNKNEVWSGYKISEIFDSLKEARTSNVVVMFDVCRKPYSKPLLTENYLRRLEPLPNWLVVANETVRRKENISSGPLTDMILQGESGKADKDGDGLISLRELTLWLHTQNNSENKLIIINPSTKNKLLDYPLSNK